MKILSVGAELFHEERRTDSQTDRHDEANGRFSQFCERAYKLLYLGKRRFKILYLSLKGKEIGLINVFEGSPQ